ncbi:hypothetical protein B0H14DRAFT_2899988 [Mycena olivaceomarginata]|nr:hypothetical protein B0H14DRAFT_2899988 [Mycena olivaceomarginata]
MLGQAEISKYFDQCQGCRRAIEEVLSGYISWKYIKGATSERVLIKLRYLTIYLHVTGRRQVLEVGADAFKVLTLEVSLGGGRIGLLPATTVPGKAVWNQIRRAAPRVSTSLVTDAVYGGPGPVQEYLSPSQSQPPARNHERTPWAERYFLARVELGDVPPGILEQHYNAGHSIMTLPLYASRDSNQALAEQIPAEYFSASQMALTLPPYASRDDVSVNRSAGISA